MAQQMLNIFVSITGRSVLQVGSEESKMGYKMPLNVPGVGPKLADKIIDKVYQEYDQNDGSNYGHILSNSGSNEVG